MPKFIVDAVQDNIVTLAVAGANYRNSFQLAGDTKLQVGQTVRGTIHAPAWKIDRVELGGNYVEPLYGRPRRMQGTISAVDAAGNELTVQVGYEVTVKLPDRYRAADYAVGTRVGWDNLEIPRFALAPAAAPV